MTAYMTVAEAADYLGVNRHTVDRYVRQGKLTRYKVPGRESTRFQRAEVEALAAPKPENEGADGAFATVRS